jgi:hypothetical protein
VSAKTLLEACKRPLWSAVFATWVGSGATWGCTRTEPAPSGAPSASASGGPASAPSAAEKPKPNPLTRELVDKTVNAANLPVYSGKTGTVRGTITVKGDEAPVLTELIAKIPSKCAPAREVYGKLFREGMLRSLADVLVTVTGYDGYVPAKSEARLVEVRDCAWDARTIALMFGQRIDVRSKDREPYLPDLLGGSMPAQLVVMPNAKDPVSLYPMKVGRFGLADSLHPFMLAEVYVVKFPTFAVTGLDGKYEISGVPVGEVTVNALLPATMVVAEKKVKVSADQAVVVDLEIVFDKKKHGPKPVEAAAQKNKGKAPLLH